MFGFVTTRRIFDPAGSARRTAAGCATDHGGRSRWARCCCRIIACQPPTFSTPAYTADRRPRAHANRSPSLPPRPESLLEWLGIPGDMQMCALEQLCMMLLLSDNVDHVFERCPPRSFLPALAKIFLDETAATSTLEVHAFSDYTRHVRSPACDGGGGGGVDMSVGRRLKRLHTLGPGLRDIDASLRSRLSPAATQNAAPFSFGLTVFSTLKRQWLLTTISRSAAPCATS